MKKFFRITFLVVILAIFAGTLIYLKQKAEEDPVVYSSVSPYTADIVKKTVATGSIVPRKEINIKSQVSGIVEKILVEAGQSIKVGDIIATIRLVPNMVNLNNAEASLKRADINLQESKKEF